MTDEQIIRALICYSSTEEIFCNDCAYQSEAHCMRAMAKDAIDLIDCQKAEIERLESELRAGRVIRAEAIKEFAERLKTKSHNYYPSIDSYCTSRRVVLTRDIDTLVKEMTEVSISNGNNTDFAKNGK